MLTNYKTVLWDFDGVLIDSMPVRDFGFREIFKTFDSEKVEQLIAYHRQNGGLSRFVKIRYFFEVLLQQPITEQEVNEYADRFSIIMREALTDKKLLIDDSVSFVKENHHRYQFHIVSGSAENELRYLVKELGIADYFQSVYGSPTTKIDNVKKVMQLNNYAAGEACLIGDSKNDYEAATANSIRFFGYNDAALKTIPGVTYIDSFSYFS